MEDLGYKPVNRYLPPREPAQVDTRAVAAASGTLRSRLADLVNRVIAL
jgi:hypothetical protein